MDTGNGQQPFHAFREHEVEQLFHWIKDGESASVIGVSNIGKSNLFQHLLDAQAQAYYLSGDAPRYLFLRVNFHNLPDFQSRSVYSLILEQMEMLDQDTGAARLPEEAAATIGKVHAALLDAGQDELKIQRFFKLAVRACLQDPERRLVLLFDQFDRLYQRAGEQLFINLRGLRDTYKYRISFLLFTRDPLPDLTVDIPLPATSADDAGDEEDREALLTANSGELAREEFYELLQPNQLYLKPYDLRDTELLLRSMSKRKRLPLEDRWIQPLYELTGGHAGLLRMCYSRAASRTLEGVEIQPAAMLVDDAVRQECKRIWASLSDDEQTALAAQARDQTVGDIDRAVYQKLKQKGMLSEDGRIFSPLFALFAREQKTRLDRPIFLDSKRRVVYYRGQRSQPLSKSEYLMFKKLYDRQNSVVSQEEILHACWPNDPYDENHSGQAISAHIYRIRKKLGISDKDKLIEAKQKQGYILNNESAD